MEGGDRGRGHPEASHDDLQIGNRLDFLRVHVIRVQYIIVFYGLTSNHGFVERKGVFFDPQVCIQGRFSGSPRVLTGVVPALDEKK